MTGWSKIVVLVACLVVAGLLTMAGVWAEEPANTPTAAVLAPSLEMPNPSYQEVAVDPNADNDYCLDCHGRLGFSNGTRDLSINKEKYLASVHKRLRCLNCHYYITYSPHREPFPKVTCTSQCHNLPPDFKPSPTADKLAEVQVSAHAKSDEGTEGICVKCHDPHSSTTPKEWSKAEKKEKCVQCHADTALMYAHNVDWDRPAAYDLTYHNKFLSYGSTKVAVCSDCHGPHKIINSDDPASSVNSANVTKTCATQDCHPDAGGGFGQAGGHVRYHGTFVDPTHYGVERFFFWLIVIVVGALYAHLVIEFVRKGRNEWRARKKVAKSE